MTTERDTHFLGFATLLYGDLYPMFNNLFIEESNGDPDAQEAEHTKQNIQEYLAQSAYDLAIHFMSHANERMDLKLTSDQIRAWVNLGIPDLTALPAPQKDDKR